MIPRKTTYTAIDPPELIARTKPLREGRRPLECNGAANCWVEVARAGLLHTIKPVCAGCNGKIL